MQLHVNQDEDGGKTISKADANLNLLNDVYSLVEIIENHQKQIEKQIKVVQGSKKRADKALNRDEDGDNVRSESVKAAKEVMCPLGDYCPDFLKNRWPISNKKGIIPIGNECPFAHHAFNIASKAFLKTNTRLKKDLIEKLKDELKNPHSKKVEKGQTKPGQWNPAGNPLSVSARYFNIKDARSSFVQTNTFKSTNFQKQAEKHNERLKSSEKVNTKMEIMKKIDTNYRLKMGFLNRSKILYEKRRFKESFQTIIKAVAIVKKEQDEYNKAHEELKKNLKEKLDIDLEEEPNGEILLRLQEYLKKPKPKDDDEDLGGDDDKDKTLENFKDVNYQKLVYYAEKTGLIGEKVANVDQDLKDEIEEV